MKITFVIPGLNLTGGIRVVSIYAELLAKKGHTVTVVSPDQRLPTLKEKIKSALKWKGYKFESGFNQTFFLNANYKVNILDKHRPVVSEDVPPADIIIATFWNTAEWIVNFPESKGKKVYFIQHYEVHPWLPVERVKATLNLPYEKIVVSQWIADTLLAMHGSNQVKVVSNGVDSQQFYGDKRGKQLKTTFGIMYSLRSYKGCHIAFKAFEKAKLVNPNIALVAFGSEEPNEELPLPEGTKYYCLPKQTELASIYGMCDAWLFSSSTEGFGLPILEAMACRTPVIGTRCGAAEMLINNTNGFLVDINDSEAMSHAMCVVSNMSDEAWQEYSLSAYLTSTKYRWEDTVAMFEEALISI